MGLSAPQVQTYPAHQNWKKIPHLIHLLKKEEKSSDNLNQYYTLKIPYFIHPILDSFNNARQKVLCIRLSIYFWTASILHYTVPYIRVSILTIWILHVKNTIVYSSNFGHFQHCTSKKYYVLGYIYIHLLLDSFSITLYTVLYIRVSINITRPRCSQSQTEKGDCTHLCCRDPQQSRCNDENCLHDAPIPVSPLPGRWTATTDIPGPVGFIPSACLPVSHLSEDDSDFHVASLPRLTTPTCRSSRHTDRSCVHSRAKRDRWVYCPTPWIVHADILWWTRAAPRRRFVCRKVSCSKRLVAETINLR